MKSIMPAQKNFAKVPQIGGIQRSVFNRSHAHKTTFDAGELIPFYVDEILPGDSISLNAQLFGRLSSPMSHPIFDNLSLDTHYFFVPARIIWDNWEKFNGAQDNPGDPIDFVIPTVDYGDESVQVGSIGDYFGLPIIGASDTLEVNALPFRAYNKIWNEWFRSQDLQDSVEESTGDTDNYLNYEILKRGKRHDYFTTCLPSPQKGDPVGISLTGSAPVYGDGKALGLTRNDGTQYGLYSRLVGGGVNDYPFYPHTAAYGWDLSNTGGLPSGNENGQDREPFGVVQSGFSGLIADLTDADAVLINDLRDAISVQHVLEIDQRSGTRYVEMLKAHFGVVSPDFRLQRPEYLGGGTAHINVNPVTQTSETDTTGQGTQTAHGTMGSSSGFSKSFVEHGYVIGLVSVRADLTYQYGVHKMWTRSTRYDFYLPSFANLGEQAVLNKEIYFQSTPSIDDNVFGYQERWAEMRYKPSLITGKFRSAAAGTLDAWHLSEKFTALPELDNQFIEDNTFEPLQRSLVVQDEPQILMDSYISIRHARPMPVYSVPGLDRI